MGDLPKNGVSASSIHNSMLEEVVGRSSSPSVLLYSYKRSFNGFAATLTEEEMQKLKGMDGVVSVFPNQMMQLHTTRSWDSIGFHQKINRTTVESDVIIGMLDSGIWPESESFSDEGFGSPPSKWKGSCTGFTNFTCNEAERRFSSWSARPVCFTRRRSFWRFFSSFATLLSCEP